MSRQRFKLFFDDTVSHRFGRHRLRLFNFAADDDHYDVDDGGNDGDADDHHHTHHHHHHYHHYHHDDEEGIGSVNDGKS